MNIRYLMLGLVLAVTGCGARGEVAKEHVLAKVDKLLGEINVKKKETEIAVRGMESGLDQLKKGKIEAKVKLAQATEKLVEMEARTGKVDQALLRLRDHLQDDQEAEVNGRSYTAAELKNMADRAVSARKRLASERDVIKASAQRLESIVATYEQREQDGRDRLRILKQHLDDIDTKSFALKSMQDAASFMGSTETLDFAAVEKQVRDLSTKIDVELAFQDEKWQEINTDQKSLETIIRETSTASDTLTEIDALLGLN